MKGFCVMSTKNGKVSRYKVNTLLVRVNLLLFGVFGLL